jgi:hypothetical protein
VSDDSSGNGHNKSIDARFDPGQDEEIRSIERRLGLLAAEVRIARESTDIKLAKLAQQGEFIVDFLKAINAKLDRALNNLDGLDVRNRLSAIESEVLPKPKRVVRAGKK